MLKLTWTETGLDDLAWWVDKNPKILKRIIKLGLGPNFAHLDSGMKKTSSIPESTKH